MTPETDLLSRMVRAVARVRERLLRAVGALESAKIPYAIVGGHAVAAWVATMDLGGVRNTPDVDILIRRIDLSHAATAMQSAGFVQLEADGLPVFLDGPSGRIREAVFFFFAGEEIRSDHDYAAPDLDDIFKTERFDIARSKLW